MKVMRKIGVAALGIPAMVAALSVPAMAAPGTVKVNEAGVSSTANDPHVSCPFGVLQFEVAGTPTFELVAPTPGPAMSTFESSPGVWTVTVPDGVTPQANQGFHVRVSVGNKTKTIWTGSCDATPPSGGEIFG